MARDAAELLLRRMMDDHQLGRSEVYDKALQLFYKEKEVIRAIMECVIQAYTNPRA